VVATIDLRLARTSSVPMAGVPAFVSWSLAPGRIGLRRYDLQVQRDGGAFTALALPSPRATLHAGTLLIGHIYTYRVRAVDSAGHIGPWTSVGPRQALNVADASPSITWSGAWSTIALNAYLGGSAHSTGAAGATATLQFHGTSVAWVGPTGPTRGKAQVYLDGRLVATVDLGGSAFHPRQVVFAASVPDGAHTLVIRSLGTAGRSTVNVDSIYVIQPH